MNLHPSQERMVEAVHHLHAGRPGRLGSGQALALGLAAVSRPITERMAEAIRLQRVRWPKRYPVAFYLSPDDWRDFMATNPSTINAKWNLAPSVEPGFDRLPVRASTSETSRLYDSVRQGKALPA